MARIVAATLCLGASERVNVTHIAGWGLDSFGNSYVEFNGVTRREEGRSMYETLNDHFLPTNHYSRMLEEMAVNA